MPEGSVYIGRGTPWGNPFEIGRDGSRAEVLAKWRNLLNNDLELRRRAREELAGLNLVCSCKPKSCHGDPLIKVANQED
jgi:hypothetical protein